MQNCAAILSVQSEISCKEFLSNATRDFGKLTSYVYYLRNSAYDQISDWIRTLHRFSALKFEEEEERSKVKVSVDILHFADTGSSEKRRGFLGAITGIKHPVLLEYALTRGSFVYGINNN